MRHIIIPAVVASLLPLAAAHGAFQTPALAGQAQNDAWVNFSSTNFPGTGNFPGLTPWSGPLQSNVGGDAFITKTNSAVGGAYVASGSLYFGSFQQGNLPGATVRLNDTTPSPDLGVVILQLVYGEQLGLDFYNDVLPVLNYNGGAQAVAPTTALITERVQVGEFVSPVTGTEPLYNNTYFIAWDLSSVATPITSFDVSFTGNVHSQVYSIQLDQGAIPEPAMATAALPALALLRRRR